MTFLEEAGLHQTTSINIDIENKIGFPFQNFSVSFRSLSTAINRHYHIEDTYSP